jgi:PAS domain S-box-containing protein
MPVDFSANPALFRILTESAMDATFIVDTHNVFIYANPAAYRVFKMDYEKQELIGFDGEQVWLEEDLPFLHNVVGPQAMAGGWSGEVRNRRADGSIFYLQASAFGMYDAQGQPIGMGVVLRDVSELKQAEAETRRLQEQIIDAQRQALQELSTPIIPVLDRIIVMPLIGSIDTMRAKDITRALLAGISRYRAKIVIVDITGVPIVDSGVADHLNKTIQAARLKGAQTIITGMSDAVAEAIIDLGIDWSNIQTLSDLQTGLMVAIGTLGLKLTHQ